jgi:hypothetical protein
MTINVMVATQGEGDVTRGRDHRLRELPPGLRPYVSTPEGKRARAPAGPSSSADVCQGPRALTKRSSRLGRPHGRCAASNPRSVLADGPPPAQPPDLQLNIAAASGRSSRTGLTEGGRGRGHGRGRSGGGGPGREGEGDSERILMKREIRRAIMIIKFPFLLCCDRVRQVTFSSSLSLLPVNLPPGRRAAGPLAVGPVTQRRKFPCNN